MTLNETPSERDQRLKELRKEEPDVVIKAIQESVEPWWEIAFIHPEKKLMAVKEVKDAMMSRADYIADALKENKEPWTILWGIGQVEEFFRYEPIVEGIVYALKHNENAWQTYEEIKEYRWLMKDERIQDALVLALRNHNGPWFTLDVILDYYDLETEQRTIDAIIHQIEHSDHYYLLIQSILDSEFLFNHPSIRKAIEQRIPDIAHGIRKSEKNWDILRSIEDIDYIIENDLVIDAIVYAIEKTNEALRLIWRVCEIPSLIQLLKIQRVIAKQIRESKDFISILYYLQGNRRLVESDVIREAILNKISDISNQIRTEDYPIQTAQSITGFYYLLEYPEIQEALRSRASDLLRQSFDYDLDIFEKGQALFFLRTHNEFHQYLADYLRGCTYGNRLEKIAKSFSEVLQDKLVIQSIIDLLGNTEYPHYIIGALEDTALRHNQEVLRAIETRIQDIVTGLQTEEIPWYEIEEIAVGDILIEHQTIREAILNVILKSDNGWICLPSLMSKPELIENEQLQDSILEHIEEIAEYIRRDKKDLPLFLDRFYEVPFLRENTTIQDAYLYRIDEIIEDIETRREFWYDIGSISDNPIIVTQKRVQEAILKREKDLIHHLRFREDAWNIIGNICGVEYLLDSEQIREAISHVIERTNNPWFFEYYGELQQFIDEQRIKEGFLTRVEDFAYWIKHGPNSCEVEAFVKMIPYLYNNEMIKSAIENICES
ncbi:MAG: hypothetical protein GF411_20350 [Candidatus Lokiarchaeota archaeon]|nr:hypothetical protein [Candidatus Lokiarchaeota archaeon]